MDLFIVTVKYQDIDMAKPETNFVVVYANSFTEAVEQVEQYYGDVIVDMKIDGDFEPGTLLKIPEGSIDTILNANKGIY